VRASSVDPFTTAMQGVNTDRVSIIVVALGTALAGLSGTIAAPLLALSPSMGGYILIESFIVVVVGGLGSFTGAFVAAIVIGEIHNIGCADEAVAKEYRRWQLSCARSKLSASRGHSAASSR
jgi:branched-chain amino acid transport system permease protein